MSTQQNDFSELIIYTSTLYGNDKTSDGNEELFKEQKKSVLKSFFKIR